MQDLKADAVQFLLRDKADQRDRDAAKLLAATELDIRHVPGGEMDVLINIDSETDQRAHRDDTAGRIENALRESAEAPVRHLQWIQQETGLAQGPGAGAGDRRGGTLHSGEANSAKPAKPRFDKQGQDEFQAPDQPGDSPVPPKRPPDKRVPRGH